VSLLKQKSQWLWRSVATVPFHHSTGKVVPLEKTAVNIKKCHFKLCPWQTNYFLGGVGQGECSNTGLLLLVQQHVKIPLPKSWANTEHRNDSHSIKMMILLGDSIVSASL